jgi:predicted O-methyltransferase YrrM
MVSRPRPLPSEVCVDIVHREIDRLLRQSSGPEDPTLREIEGFAAEHSFPIVGPQVGRLPHVPARMIPAGRVPPEPRRASTRATRGPTRQRIGSDRFDTVIVPVRHKVSVSAHRPEEVAS